ncbi:secreted phosphoprotein 24 isoform X3 [Balaenoptera musculus]|uniref:Secreted phosphoprotein 24 n=1 Tax=Balaenoptera musculus TaxID=9771 RepID=A0A8B8Y645_BALMU|nr:secreted phosphoprotein 24 isoform X3 [Balaenoptera musculus]
MEKMVMKVFIMFVLGTNYWSHYCAGFPVYDYDPSSLREAVSASVAKVNSQSLSPYLFRAFRSSIRRVNMLDEDSLTMDIEFGIRETTCRRGSREDPATCDFQRGYYAMVWGDILGSSTSRNNYLLGLTPDRSRSEPFYERSLEIMRRGFPSGNRRNLNLWPRARVNTGFE